MSRKSIGNHQIPSKLQLWAVSVFFWVSVIIVPHWGTEQARWGAITGVAIFLILCIFVVIRWRIRYSESDLQKSRGYLGAAKGPLFGFILLGSGILYWLVKFSPYREYAMALASTTVALSSVIVLIMAYSHKGLWQS
jgi:hypothetical protein